jgi:3-methylfumaryl-CoA hydratase
MTDIGYLKSWIGRTETARDRATPGPLAGLAALLDHATPPWIANEAPPLSHWLYFHAPTRQSELGPDGHPRRGGFLPPVELPRRMFAGARIVFHAPVPVDAKIARVSTIEAVEAKTGRSGAMIFVAVKHEISAGGTPAVTEEQDIVYRDAPKPGAAAAAAAKPDTRRPDVTRTIRPDPVLLFRYSAVTFNGHRIHYDRDYCRDVEGYPGLVVHGPLIATLLVDHFLRVHSAACVTRFSFRARRPLFDIAPFDLCLAERPGGADLWARNHKGEVAVTAALETA